MLSRLKELVTMLPRIEVMGVILIGSIIWTSVVREKLMYVLVFNSMFVSSTLSRVWVFSMLESSFPVTIFSCEDLSSFVSAEEALGVGFVSFLSSPSIYSTSTIPCIFFLFLKEIFISIKLSFNKVKEISTISYGINSLSYFMEVHYPLKNNVKRIVFMNICFSFHHSIVFYENFYWIMSVKVSMG